MKKGDHLFVYGTLRLGQPADLSRSGRVLFVRPDRISGTIYDLGWYPGVKLPENHSMFSPSSPSVSGDVFLIEDESEIARLDNYEGYPSLYNRMVVQTESGLPVWVYTYNYETLPQQIISSGVWERKL